MLDAEHETLFAAPREAFVAERQRLVRELKKAGRAQDAAALAALPKPTLAAWVVNQLARQRRPLVKALGLAGARLREVQLGMTDAGAGADARAAYAQAVAAQREALGALRAAAEELLAAAGSGAPVSLLEAVLRTLRTGAASDIAQATIEQGRLLREPEGQDLGALAASLPAEAAVAVASNAAEATSVASALDEAATSARMGDAVAVARAEADERQRRAAAEAAARAAAQVRARARADAQREVEELRRSAGEAERERARQDEALARARQVLAESEVRASRARAAAETAAARLADADRRLRELPP